MVDTPAASTVVTRPHRPWLAALLSFVFPGLGQANAGRWRRAAIFAVPVILLIATIGAALAGLAGDQRNSLFSSEFLFGVLVVNVLLCAWRIGAIWNAAFGWRVRIGSEERNPTLPVVAALILVTIAMHAWVGGVVLQIEGTLGQVFQPVDNGTGALGAPPTDDDGDGEEPQPTPEPTFRWDGTDRINVLLLGTDAAPGREAVLTDVILVVSVDPVAQTAVMISVPRDTGFVPLPDESLYAGGVYPDKVNSLAERAAEKPAAGCPDANLEGAACGIRAIERSIGLYLGIEIHHYALVDMAGFAELIDALGGLELCLPGTLVDPEFDGSLTNEKVTEPLVLPAGCHEYNGLDALAYARSRKGWIEMPDGERVQQTDFDRSERQQRVLLAMREELAEADTFIELPDILSAVGRTVSTDFPRDQAGDLASLVPLITGPDIERIVLAYPVFVDLPTQPEVNYLLIPKRDAIRSEMERIFGEDYLSGWYLTTDAASPSAVNPTP
jgi:LCP family protein required for cell wall assembly